MKLTKEDKKQLITAFIAVIISVIIVFGSFIISMVEGGVK